jgi:hypothetical protein
MSDPDYIEVRCQEGHAPGDSTIVNTLPMNHPERGKNLQWCKRCGCAHWCQLTPHHRR